MKTEIYYFSGTGNSLFVAKDIARRTNGKLISIPTMMDNYTIQIDADIIGIVFPTYYEPYGGVPLIVRKFARKLEKINSKYLFAICTYGSGSFKAINCLEEIIESRGGKLTAGFTVNMPNNMAGPSLNNSKKQEKMFHVWEENIDYISAQICARKKVRFHTPNVLAGKTFGLIRFIVSLFIFLFKPLTLSHLKRYSNSENMGYEEMLPYMDRSFSTNEKCDGCGNCAKICPVNNIEIVENRPKWLHNCEFCLACFHWCHKMAIDSIELKNTIRYHHPNVKLSEMMMK